MQKLRKRNINTPTNAPQVRSNCDLSLNKEETLSVPDLKTSLNNPEVDQHQHTGELKAVVYVISIDGNPLMPCSNAKARKLLKSNKAKVVKLYPFTIKLNFECENKVQDITLGIDTGYGNIGFSCVTETEEVMSGTLVLDSKTSSRLTERRMYRKLKRRKLWYRKPRFLNRKKKQGWLPPSIQRRYVTHIRLISRIKAILPISKIIIETANFDIQKIENPEIESKVYQQGGLYDYHNMRSYLMAREKGLCQLCKKKFEKGRPSHIHHCLERSKQGSNRAKNLAIIHKKCHEKLHKKDLKLSAPKSYKPYTFMSIINKRFQLDIPEAEITFGYVTHIKRNELGLKKTHTNDAFVIAGGKSQNRNKQTTIGQKHKNSRKLQCNRKGYKPSIRSRRYDIQSKDLIWIGEKKYISRGTTCNGNYTRLIGFDKPIKTKNIQKKYNFGTFAYC